MSNQDSKYHIISELTKDSDTYRDWEGMSDTDEVIEAITNHPSIGHMFQYLPNTLQQAALDILANILYEYLDNADELPEEMEIYFIAETIYNLLHCNRWLKSGGKWNIEKLHGQFHKITFERSTSNES